jgi:N utilization substance protein B
LCGFSFRAIPFSRLVLSPLILPIPHPSSPIPEELRKVFPPGPFLDRRLGRGLAFQALYEMDLAHHVPGQVLERLAQAFEDVDPAMYPAEVLRGASDYAAELVSGVLAHRPAIDALIQQRAPLWPLAQMSAVDRNVLRIGLYESLYGNATVPLRTAINEAVELAKLFGSETSAKFVNGVLGRAVEASASGEGQPHAPGASDRSSHPATPA